MEQYLMDTNIVSDYLTANLTSKSLDFMDEIIDQTPKLSIISKIELLCWQTNKETKNKITDFINDSNVLNITDEVVKFCVELRQKRKIKTPDAIIAATALANNYILLTKNIKDFQNIKGLKIINPNSL
jgi:predicted nucleic acid-binding protein